jgi:hypothetical protein
MPKTSKPLKPAGRSSKLVGDGNERGTELMPCPLCAGKPYDKGYGISCEGCGLWLGDGSQAYRLGGYKRLWNRRAQNASSPIAEFRNGGTGCADCK